MDEQRLAEIEARRVQVALGKWGMPLPHDPYVWTHVETGVLVNEDVPDLISEVRRLQAELSYLKACQV